MTILVTDVAGFLGFYPTRAQSELSRSTVWSTMATSRSRRRAFASSRHSAFKFHRLGFIDREVVGELVSLHASTERADEVMSAHYAVHYISGLSPVETLELIPTLERVLGRRACVERVLPEPHDVPHACADVSRERDCGRAPNTRLADGITRFANWFVGYSGAFRTNILAVRMGRG